LFNFRFTIASDCFLLSQKILRISEIIVVNCSFLLQVPLNQPAADDEDEPAADDEDEPAADDDNEPAKEHEPMDTGVSRRQPAVL